MSIYQEAKYQLREIAREEKRNHKNDKPMIRQIINDTADSLSKDFPASLTEEKRERYTRQLQNYACQLHPKSK